MNTPIQLEHVRAAVSVNVLVHFHTIGHVDEYIRFLTPKLLSHDVDELPPKLSASQSVDAVWHTHMFKHVPGSRSDTASYDETLRLYEDYFGVRPNRCVWPRAATLTAPPPQRMIKITVKDAMTGRLSPVTISPTATIAQLKVLVLNVDGTAIKSQHLVFGDSKRLRDYRIRDKSVVKLVRKLVVCCSSSAREETSGEQAVKDEEVN